MAIPEPVPTPRLPAGPRWVGAADIDAVEGTTRRLRALDYRYGGGRCVDLVMASLPAARALLGVPATDAVATRLRTAVADLHNLAGWVCFDVGLYDDAVRQFGQALELARRGDDHALAANVHYRLGRVYLHHNAPGRALAEFDSGTAAAEASGSALATAILHANQSWAKARMGVRDEALTLITAAATEFARADVAAAPGWAAFFTSTDLLSITGVVHTELAATVDPRFADVAIVSLSTAGKSYGADMTRSKAFCLISLATAHLLAGEARQAAAAGHRAIDLCQGLASVRTVSRLRVLGKEAARRCADDDIRRLTGRIDAFRQAVSSPSGRWARA
jgi:tetratricopeptide (TPR) repeat protein